MNEYFTLLDDLTSAFVRKIQIDREKIILKKIRELGIVVDFSLEHKRRFKKLTFERKDNEETLYFDDGSLEGLRIVTFITKNNKSITDPMQFDIVVTYY